MWNANCRALTETLTCRLAAVCPDDWVWSEGEPLCSDEIIPVLAALGAGSTAVLAEVASGVTAKPELMFDLLTPVRVSAKFAQQLTPNCAAAAPSVPILTTLNGRSGV